jgi:hypothetical protein
VTLVTRGQDGEAQMNADVVALTLRANLNVTRSDNGAALPGAVVLVREKRQTTKSGHVVLDPQDGYGHFGAYGPGVYAGTPVLVEIVERVSRAWYRSFPNRRFGVGDLFATSHRSHSYGTAVDIMAIRNDGKEEVKTYGKPDVAVWPSGTRNASAVASKETTCPEGGNAARYDQDGMEALLRLFVEMTLLAAGGEPEPFQQIIFEDKVVVLRIRGWKPQSRIGTEADHHVHQGTHTWHAHLLLRI